jgi:hypothetical protein
MILYFLLQFMILLAQCHKHIADPCLGEIEYLD